MRPEDKVVNLITAKKLKEAGFPQDTERWWDLSAAPFLRAEPETLDEMVSKHMNQIIAAPDATELGELLPSDALGCFNRTLKGGWAVHIDEDDDTAMYLDTEAEARAAAWLYLKENGLI